MWDDKFFFLFYRQNFDFYDMCSKVDFRFGQTWIFGDHLGSVLFLLSYNISLSPCG